MGKFDNIKVGDSVLVEKTINYGWHEKTFLCFEKVTKTTPAQFLIGERRYRKSDGYLIGGGYFNAAYLEGEPRHLGRVAQDQTKEYLEFVAKVNAIDQVGYLMLSFQRKRIDIDKIDREEFEKIGRAFEELLQKDIFVTKKQY